VDAYLPQLRANLDAMRHLPGGTRLPQPATAEERALLANLVQLPESIDPLQWLQDKRGPLTARITLYETLGFLKSFVGTAWIEAGDERAVVRDVVGGLVDRASGMTPTMLREAVRRLQPLRHLSPAVIAISRGQPLSPPDRLLLDLLALPPSVDPLAWLQHEHGAYAARTAFRTVVEQGLPSHKAAIGHPIRVFQLTDVWRTEQLQIGVTEIMFGPQGFALAIIVQIAVPSIPPPPPWVQDPTHGDELSGLPSWAHWLISIPCWEGFDQVMDDRGHRYIVRTSEQSVSAGHKSLRGHLPDVFESAVYGRLHMAFYPAVVVDATELRFTSDGITSRTYHPELPDDTSLLPEMHFDPFTWRLVIPR
jgi:hypothetical protein